MADAIITSRGIFSTYNTDNSLELKKFSTEQTARRLSSTSVCAGDDGQYYCAANYAHSEVIIFRREDDVWREAGFDILSSMDHLTYIDGVFFATRNKDFWRSENGRNWQSIQVPAVTANTNACPVKHPSSGILISGGFPAVALYSDDNGETWKQGSMPTGSYNPFKIIYSSQYNAFFCCGQGGRVLFSEDGKTWSLRTNAGSGQLNSMACNDITGRLVVTASGGGTFYSDNGGQSWIAGNSLGFTVGFGKGITCGDGRFVAAGSEGILSSEDGVTWTSRYNLPNMRDVIWANDLFVAVGDNGCATSVDGITWTYEKIEGMVGEIWAMTKTSNKLIGYGNSACWFSEDEGKIWNCCGRAPDWIFSISSVEDLERNIKILLAFKGVSAVYYSENDGETWKTASGISANIRQISYGNGVFLAVSTENVVFRSNNGKNWEQTTETNNHSIHYIPHAKKFWRLKNNSNEILKSEDGIQWTNHSILPSAICSWATATFYCVDSSIYFYSSSSNMDGGNTYDRWISSDLGFVWKRDIIRLSAAVVEDNNFFDDNYISYLLEDDIIVMSRVEIDGRIVSVITVDKDKKYVIATDGGIKQCLCSSNLAGAPAGK